MLIFELMQKNFFYMLVLSVCISITNAIYFQILMNF